MKKSLLFALCLGLATITAAAQRNNSQVDPIQPVPTAKQVAWQKLETYAFIRVTSKSVWIRHRSSLV